MIRIDIDAIENAAKDQKPVALRVKYFGEIAGGVMAWSEWISHVHAERCANLRHKTHKSVTAMFA